jgi:hypothetical protein
MFKQYLKMILPYCIFPGDNRDFKKPIATFGWATNASRCQIDLYGANAGNKEHSPKGGAKLQAVLSMGNIVWSRKQFLTGDKIKISNYDFLLLVPSPPGLPVHPPVRRWASGSGDWQGGTLETTPQEKTHRMKGKTWRRTDIMAINRLYTIHPVLQYSPHHIHTSELLFPYTTNLITLWTPRQYIDRAADQVRACVRGFIEEELHGESEA